MHVKYKLVLTKYEALSQVSFNISFTVLFYSRMCCLCGYFVKVVKVCGKK